MKNLLRVSLPIKIYNFIRVINLFRLILNNGNSYLNKTGYINAYVAGKPIDKHNNAIPWMNYAIINFFDSRLNKGLSVFEYGSGYSTIYFANKIKNIVSIEYDKKWFEIAKKLTKPYKNVTITYKDLSTNYADAVLDQEFLFDIIVIDGRNRVECAINSIKRLSDVGVLVLDDSLRTNYKAIWDFYIENGFKELTFTGLKPMGFSIDSTTIFYRTNNCLRI
jgi:hypothetical protein